MPSAHPFTISLATAEQEPFLWLMLTYAALMGEGGGREVAKAQADPYLRAYVEHWGRRAGDLGVVAHDRQSRPVGAAWLRLGHHDHPQQVGDGSLPELATGVVPKARGQGVGTAMLRHLIELAAPLHPRILLSVRMENPARGFYERLGFTAVAPMTNRVGGDSLVMALDLPRTDPP
jgi:ribosomal protein S18 acetylase RimI-like enzyme